MLDKIRILKITFFPKFTYRKSHFWQNLPFKNHNFLKIHILKISFLDKIHFLKITIFQKFTIFSTFRWPHQTSKEYSRYPQKCYRRSNNNCNTWEYKWKQWSQYCGGLHCRRHQLLHLLFSIHVWPEQRGRIIGGVAHQKRTPGPFCSQPKFIGIILIFDD